MDNPVDAKPLEMPPLLAHVQAAVDTLSACETIKAAIEGIKRDEEKTIADQIAITEVEAPPFHEDVRAKELARRFEELGLEAKIDEEGNVLARRAGTGNGPTLVLAAHLDTVFPAGTNVKVRKEGNRYFAPGISDDARGLAVNLQVLRTLQEFNIKTVGDILFVCSVGEEGNGDLRGSKYLFNKSGIQIDGFISVDGVNVNRVLRGATGSKRYRVHYDGPGGHSWNAFGTPSAIHAMGRAIAKVADVETTCDPKTTFTCGTIKGGTTVNSIAAHVEMELDMRSAGAQELDDLEARLLPIFEQAAKDENARWGCSEENGVKLTLEPIGHRPGGGQSDDVSVLQAARGAMAALDIPLYSYAFASTDHNVAVNKGVPATTLGGGGKEGFNHNVKEWWEPVDAYLGPQLALLTSLVLVGVDGCSEPVLEKRA